MVTKEQQKYYYERWKRQGLARLKITRLRKKLEGMLRKPLLQEEFNVFTKEKLKILKEMEEGKKFDESTIKKYFHEEEKQALKRAGMIQ